MGIKSLTQIIKKECPNGIKHENLYNISGKRVAVDASLMIYQQLLSHHLQKNTKGEITNHITGLFYKLVNYLSLNIELIFVFDGKPPVQKYECIKERKEKAQKAKEKMVECENVLEKEKLEKTSIRLTIEMIDNVKKLLNLMGVPYIHLEVGEGEAIASELCRIGYVDYVLTEDMDALVYGCPKLIRNCIDKSVKTPGIISVLYYEDVIKGLELNEEQFIKFSILCGCDYCPNVPKVGTITALKMIKKYNTVDEIIEAFKDKYKFPDNYKELFDKSYEIFTMHKDKLNPEEIVINRSNRDIGSLINFLVKDIEMNELRVQNGIKKIQNILND
jgi:flap endonuclease-1